MYFKIAQKFKTCLVCNIIHLWQVVLYVKDSYEEWHFDFKELKETFLLFYISAQWLKVNSVCMMGQGLS